MKIPFIKNKKINKKCLYVILIVIAFFAVQIAIIFYAKNQFGSKGCVAGGDMNSVNYNMLYRIDQRISSLQSELNYIRGYIVSKNK